MKPLANPSESRKAGEALMVDIVLNNNTFNRISRDSPISFSKELIKKKKKIHIADFEENHVLLG